MKRILMSAAAFAMFGAGAAVADTHVTLHQSFVGLAQSHTAAHLGAVGTDVDLSSTAGGNAFEGALNGAKPSLNIGQFFFGNAVATTTLGAHSVHDDVMLSARAFSNSITATAPDARKLTSHTHQAANIDPSAYTTAHVGSIGDDFRGMAMATSNALSLEAPKVHYASVRAKQINAATVNAATTVGVGSVGGDLTGIATGIGNSISLTTPAYAGVGFNATQKNFANVNSSVTIGAGWVGNNVVGASTAIGNLATLGR